MVVCEWREVRPGTVVEARRTPRDWSMSDTVMASFIWMSLPSTVGVKLSWIPNLRYSTAICPSDCGRGIGNSPPARNVALLPDMATRVGSAMVRA